MSTHLHVTSFLQCTATILHALFDVCAAITRAHSYGWDGARIQTLCADLGDDVLSMFEGVSSKDVGQRGALQMFVDFAVVTSYLSNRGAHVNNMQFAQRVQAIEAAIQEKVCVTGRWFLFLADCMMAHWTFNSL